MFSEQLKKILRLAKQTGDRVIIYDGASPDDSYVVMDLDAYLDLLGEKGGPEAPRVASPTPRNIPEPVAAAIKGNLTEEDLTDKINREISVWKNKENAPDVTEDSRPKKAWQIPPIVKDKAQEVE